MSESLGSAKRNEFARPGPTGVESQRTADLFERKLNDIVLFGLLFDQKRRRDTFLGRRKHANSLRPQAQVATRGQQHHPRRKQQADNDRRSEEHTSELQSLMRNSYAVFC